MMIRHLIIAIVALATLGCTNDSTRELENIERLILENKDDSAYNEICKMDSCTSIDDETKAHHHLLKTQLLYRKFIETENDSLIDFSIAYYKKSNNNRKLALSYYYKSRSESDRGNIQNAIELLCEAKTLADKTDDNLLKAKIYYSLGGDNMKNSEYNHAKALYIQGIGYAKKAKNNALLAGCLRDLSSIYSTQEKADSAIYYAEEGLKLINTLAPHEQAIVLSTMSYVELTHNNDIASAKKYAEQALEQNPQIGMYQTLGLICAYEGNGDEAMRLWQKGIENSTNLNGTISIYTDIFNYLNETGRNAEASQISKKIIALRDSFAKRIDEDSIVQIQNNYATKAEVKETSDKFNITFAWWAVVAISAGIAAAYVARKIIRKKNGIIKENEKTIQSKQAQIEDTQKEMNKILEEINDAKKDVAAAKAKLEKEREQHHSDNMRHLREAKKKEDNANEKIAKLEKELDKLTAKRDKMSEELKKQQAARLAKGKELYNAALNNKQIKKCGNNEYEMLKEFYCTAIDNKFEEKTKLKYNKKLTPYNWAALILLQMGKEQKEVAFILNVDYNSLRSMLSYLNKAAKPDTTDDADKDTTNDKPSPTDTQADLKPA